MLNCFKDYKRCIHISYHIFDFIQQKKPKFTMEQPYMLPILYCQNHACWCPGHLRSQGITNHSIDHISQNIPSLASEKQERLKRRNTLVCLDQYAAQNSKYARPPIPSQPPTQKVFFQWHTQYDPTMKHSHCESLCQGVVPMAVLWIVIFQIWRRSRHSRLPHGRAQ